MSLFQLHGESIIFYLYIYAIMIYRELTFKLKIEKK